MLLLIKCPEKSTKSQATKRVTESRLSSSSFFVSPGFVRAGLKLLECVTRPESSRLSPFSLVSCVLSVSWAPLSVLCPCLSESERPSSALPLFFPPVCGSLSFGPLPLSFASPSLLSLSAVLSLVIWSFSEVTESCLSFHLIYLLQFPRCHLLV